MTDVLRALVKEGIYDIDDDMHVRIGIETGLSIESPSRDWYHDYVAKIASELKLEIEDVKKSIEKVVTISESLYYIQIGNPDIISVVNTDEG